MGTVVHAGHVLCVGGESVQSRVPVRVMGAQVVGRDQAEYLPAPYNHGIRMDCDLSHLFTQRDLRRTCKHSQVWKNAAAESRPMLKSPSRRLTHCQGNA